MRVTTFVFGGLVLLACSWAMAEHSDEALSRRYPLSHHPVRLDADGKLLPWTSWEDAMDREMAWYRQCPEDPHGYPVFVFTTFMDGDYKPYRSDNIPCTQLGMGILSYLKYWEYKRKEPAWVLDLARKMGDYLVKETLTPDEGVYPRFTRSTGELTDFPLYRSSQHDAEFGANVIQPDKGGIAGYALARLYDATGDKRYLDQAEWNAALLARNMRPGDAKRAPWPFRVDAVTGEHWGERSGNQTFTLRLFDDLIARGHTELQAPRAALWEWIRTVQLPAPERQRESHWVQFFEDHHETDNRTSWSPLELARYLIERKEALDPDWKAHAERLIQFVIEHLSVTRLDGIVMAVEQDYDRRPWSGVAAKFGGVLALFHAAGGGEQYKDLAYRCLNWVSYAVDDDGCPNDMAEWDRDKRGGWQEDAHTDVLHNYIDAMTALPEWRGDGSRGVAGSQQ